MELTSEPLKAVGIKGTPALWVWQLSQERDQLLLVTRLLAAAWEAGGWAEHPGSNGLPSGIFLRQGNATLPPKGQRFIDWP